MILRLFSTKMNFLKVFTVAMGLILFVSCKKNDTIGKFVESSCPLELPADVLENGKFLYGHMQVPELSQTPNGNTL